jgi:bacteriocin-like protein
MTMSEEAKLTAQELRQSVLNRIDTARKEVEELSEEELASVAGGGHCHTDGSCDDPAIGGGSRLIGGRIIPGRYSPPPSAGPVIKAARGGPLKEL